MLNWGVLANLCRKVPFWGTYCPSNDFSRAPLNLFRQGATFTYPHDYISDHIYFLTNKVAKLVETLKFSHHVLIIYFYIRVHIHISGIMYFQKVSILSPSLGVSYKKF